MTNGNCSRQGERAIIANPTQFKVCEGSESIVVIRLLGSLERTSVIEEDLF